MQIVCADCVKEQIYRVTCQGGGCSVPYLVDNSDSSSVVGSHNKALASVVFCLLLLVSGSVEYPMPYAFSLASYSASWRLSCSSVDPWVFCLSWSTLLNGALLVCYFGPLQPFNLGCFALHHGIACLGYVHYGVACLAFQASYWTGALWDGLSGLWLVSLC